MDLTAYLDDAGTDGGNPFLIAGGFASDGAQWRRFDEAVKALDWEYDAPPFHTAIFEKARHGHGVYSKWNEERRKEYLNRLLGIIHRRTFQSFGTLLEKAVYEELIEPQTLDSGEKHLGAAVPESNPDAPLLTRGCWPDKENLHPC
jgi:hypothetical protein